MLEELGLSPTQAAAYVELIDAGRHTPTTLSAALLVTVDEAAALLSDLTAAGLATHGQGGIHRAAPPSLALASRVLEREQSLGRARLDLRTLDDRYQRSTSRHVSDIIDVAHGRDAVAQRFAQLQSGARTEVLATVRSDIAAVEADATSDEDEALARGVSYRVLFDAASLERPGFYDQVRAAVSAGSVVRAGRDVPLRMLIVDRSVAMLPLGASTTGAEGALLIHASGLLDALVLLFEELWAKGTSISGAGPHGENASEHPDSVDREMLTLLLAGVTDRGIGHQLGLSLRTVQRRVRALMDLCGATSRLQLGFEAGRRGWLSRIPARGEPPTII